MLGGRKSLHSEGGPSQSPKGPKEHKPVRSLFESQFHSGLLCKAPPTLLALLASLFLPGVQGSEGTMGGGAWPGFLQVLHGKETRNQKPFAT